MWVLQLNDMRKAPETLTAIARAETKEELESFVEGQTVETYQEEGLAKVFKKGGPLEYFNPPIPGQVHDPHFLNVGDADLWAERAKNDFELQIMSLPEAK